MSKKKRGRKNRGSGGRDWEELAKQAICMALGVVPLPRAGSRASYLKQLEQTVLNKEAALKAKFNWDPTDPEFPDNWLNLVMTLYMARPGMTASQVCSAVAAFGSINSQGQASSAAASGGSSGSSGGSANGGLGASTGGGVDISNTNVDTQNWGQNTSDWWNQVWSGDFSGASQSWDQGWNDFISGNWF